MTIQASLSDISPSSDDDWFHVMDHQITTEDTVTGLSFVGNYQWVRAYYQPDDLSTGSIIKAVLRN